MSHQEKQRIFDEYARQQKYPNWESLKKDMQMYDNHSKLLDKHIFEACDLVQEEQQKRIAEKTLINVKEPDLPSWCGTFYSSIDVQIIVDKASIINPENKIQ